MPIGRPTSGFAQQTFGLGQSAPILLLSLHDTIFRRVVEYDLMNEGQEPCGVKSAGCFEAVYFPFDFLIQNIFVYGHEIALDIQFEDITIPRVIAGARTDKMIQPS